MGEVSKQKWIMGMSVVIPKDNFIAEFPSPPTRSGIGDTWCARIKPNDDGVYRFDAYAAWELSDTRFRESNYFFNMIDAYVEREIYPCVVRLR